MGKGKPKGAKDKVKRKTSEARKRPHKGMFPKGKGNGDERQRAGGKAKKGVPGVHRPVAEELAARKIDKALIDRIITLNSHLSIKELEAKLKTGTLPALEHIICQGLSRAANTGDYNSINFFFDRLIGKVANKLDINVTDPYENMTTDELLQMKASLDEANRLTLNNLIKERSTLEIVARNIDETPEATPDESSREGNAVTPGTD